ncbi:cytochrome d ubiquinol oxidase subunit II [bacterium]|nr:cytochrome d ubiquinol oxidase subunit II [bacterium]MBP9809867.1 cytochrome d ubiquinol oxidase subunit II [bacterium]
MEYSLNFIWFMLLGVLLTGYGILDGFDLGVGILHPIAKTDEERRLIINSIGPLWDGNEVWLVTFAGALFAAFPDVYAMAFSSFYTNLMIILCALIFRAVSIEFRSKHPAKFWRQFWDACFFLSSLSASFLFGYIVGQLFLGLPIDGQLELHKERMSVLEFYPVITGLLAVATCAMHGSIFLYLKTEGELQERIHNYIWHTYGIFVMAYMLTTIFTLTQIPSATSNLKHYPWLWSVVLINILAIGNIPRTIFLKQPGYAFLSSIATIGALAALFGIAIFPNLIVSSIDPSLSLNIYNSASSQGTLKTMLFIAVLGLPFVLSYTVIVYWVFHGKVALGKFSY